jgi:hypothetical protein
MPPDSATANVVTASSSGVPAKPADVRRPIRKVAKIATGDLIYLYDCALRDISALGARIGVQDPSVIPEHIFLVFLGNQLVREARVRTRSVNEIDVDFVGPPKWLDIHREQITPATNNAVDLTLIDDQ